MGRKRQIPLPVPSRRGVARHLAKSRPLGRSASRRRRQRRTPEIWIRHSPTFSEIWAYKYTIGRLPPPLWPIIRQSPNTVPNPGPSAPPQLAPAPTLRCAQVADRLVLLDLSTGVYDVVDEIGTAMWAQLTRPPKQRDFAALADNYGVPAATVAADTADFAASQLAAGRLVRAPQPATPHAGVRARRRRPTIMRALTERAAADRDLRKGFASAYHKRTQPVADPTEPRTDVQLATARFFTAEGLYPARQAPLDCLPRSLALTSFLRAAGWPAQHVIGVALYPFEAHAWVELDGVALKESASVLHRFTVIQRA